MTASFLQNTISYSMQGVLHSLMIRAAALDMNENGTFRREALQFTLSRFLSLCLVILNSSYPQAILSLSRLRGTMLRASLLGYIKATVVASTQANQPFLTQASILTNNKSRNSSDTHFLSFAMFSTSLVALLLVSAVYGHSSMTEPRSTAPKVRVRAPSAKLY